MKRLVENKHILHVLSKSNSKLRKAILNNSDADLIRTICEICLNTLRGNTQISKTHRNELKKYKTTIRSLGTSKLPLAARRNILVQKGGFLPLLLRTLLSGVIGKLLKKKT